MRRVFCMLTSRTDAVVTRPATRTHTDANRNKRKTESQSCDDVERNLGVSVVSR